MTAETTTTTLETLDAAEIEAMRDEAGAAGDPEMVAACDRALWGAGPARAEARRLVAEAMAAAVAMADDDGIE